MNIKIKKSVRKLNALSENDSSFEKFLALFSSKTIISSNGDIVNDTNALLVETVNW